MDTVQTWLVTLGVFTIFCVILWYMWSYLYQQYWWKWVRIYNHSDGRFTIFKPGKGGFEIDTYNTTPDIEICRKQSMDILDLLWKQQLDYVATFIVNDNLIQYEARPDQLTARALIWQEGGHGYDLTFEGTGKIKGYLNYLYRASRGIIVINRLNISHASRATTFGINTTSTENVEETGKKPPAEEVHPG